MAQEASPMPWWRSIRLGAAFASAVPILLVVGSVGVYFLRTPEPTPTFGPGQTPVTSPSPSPAPSASPRPSPSATPTTPATPTREPTPTSRATSTPTGPMARRWRATGRRRMSIRHGDPMDHT
ncbi:MAG: hypothetical protein R3C32_03285 [Chloroflexota bacterium]